MKRASPRQGIQHIVARVLCSQLYWLPITAQAEPLPLDSAEQSIKLLLTQETAGVEGRVDISIGQPDPRLNLAPCQEIEPFLPPNTRPWGRINIGLRCKAGAHWSIYLPATVRVYGKALVAKKNLMSGTIPADNEVELIETELSREPGTPLIDNHQIEGRILVRAVFSGQLLKQEYFRTPPVIAQGEQVRLVASGTGFVISTDGEALHHAQEGQSVRVKTESGRVLTGTARRGHIVELKF